MSIIPVITARQLLSILLRAGFKIIHQKGSHIRLWHPITKRMTTVPMHVGDLSRNLLMKIIKQTGLSTRDIFKLR